MSLFEQNAMNAILILAWMGLVIGLLMHFRKFMTQRYLNSKTGELQQLLAGLEGQKLSAKEPHPIYNVWFFLSVAWLVAHYFIN